MFIASLNNSSDQTWELTTHKGKRGEGVRGASPATAYTQNRVWHIKHHQNKTEGGGLCL